MTRIIAHRGNLNGPNIFDENHPGHIQDVLETTQFDVEIDIRLEYVNEFTSQSANFYLGHDTLDYRMTSPQDMDNPRFWLHAKTPAAHFELKRFCSTNIFIHDKDDMAETTNGYYWLYPGREQHVPDYFKKQCVLVLPELTYGKNLEKWKVNDYYAVCTDYPLRVKEYYRNV